MRRLALLLALASLAPGQAQAQVTRCDKVAPLEGECRITVVATTARVDGLFASNLFTGVADYAIVGPTGSVTASCYAYPGVSTCVPSERGWFEPGDTVSVTVRATGAGSWSFWLSH